MWAHIYFISYGFAIAVAKESILRRSYTKIETNSRDIIGLASS